MVQIIDKEDVISIDEFIAIQGNWEKEKGIFRYKGPIKDEQYNPNHGLILFPESLYVGKIVANVKFVSKGIARIVIGLDSRTGEYYSIGLGGYDYRYVIDKYEEGKGWKAQQFTGYKQDVELNKEYRLEVVLIGQRVILSINGVKIFDFQIPEPLKGIQTGLFTWGEGVVEFSDVKIIGSEAKPKAFVIMQFSEPFQSLYEEVIFDICEKAGFFVYKADEVYEQGFILNDIINGIVESEVIIAEISSKNPNVFYELGYAHAFNKPTILLAQRGMTLPFDISGHRVIFYDDSIKGKREVEDNLEKHLKNIIK